MKNPAVLQAFAHRFLELRQLAPTLNLLISLNRALDLEVRDLVDDPAITHSDLEVPVSKDAEPLLP